MITLDNEVRLVTGRGVRNLNLLAVTIPPRTVASSSLGSLQDDPNSFLDRRLPAVVLSAVLLGELQQPGCEIGRAHV